MGEEKKGEEEEEAEERRQQTWSNTTIVAPLGGISTKLATLYANKGSKKVEEGDHLMINHILKGPHTLVSY